MNRSSNLRHGFTLIEVLAMMLVSAIGLTAAIGMILYAVQRADQSQMLNLAIATAMTVAHDATPDLDPDVSADWSCRPLAMDDRISDRAQGSAEGFINGFYVKRTEVSDRGDIVAIENNRVYARMTRVRVTVYGQRNGEMITEYAATLLRQEGEP